MPEENDGTQIADIKLMYKQAIKGKILLHMQVINDDEIGLPDIYLPENYLKDKGYDIKKRQHYHAKVKVLGVGKNRLCEVFDVF